MDLGGNILLVSNDPSEGVGVLYVIDISNPRLPVLKAAMPNGFIYTGIPGIFGLPEPQEAGIGHTASCIKDCQFAYLAGTADGIQIVDLRDPANPKKAGRFKPAITDITTHDVQVDGDGLAWIVGAGGTAAYDVRDPLNPRMVMRTDENIRNSGQLGFPGPDPVFGIGGKGETPIDLIHHDSLRFHRKSSKGRFSPRQGKTTPPAGMATWSGWSKRITTARPARGRAASRRGASRAGGLRPALGSSCCSTSTRPSSDRS